MPRADRIARCENGGMSAQPQRPASATPPPSSGGIDIAGGIGLGALALLMPLAAAIAGLAALNTLLGAVSASSIGQPPAAAASMMESALVRTVLMPLLMAPAGIGLALSQWRIAQRVAVICAWGLVGLTALLLLATGLRLALFNGALVNLPIAELAMNCVFGLLLVVFAVILTLTAREGWRAGPFVYPVIAVFFIHVIVLVAQSGLRFGSILGLNVLFAAFLAALCAILAIFARNQELLRER